MKKLYILMIALLSLLSLNAQTNIIYVNASAAGGNGSSWADAFNDLQSALEIAESGDEIWVAKGTYYPAFNPVENSTDNKDCTFLLKAGVKIYGGFPNNGDPGMENREWKKYETILDGNNVVYHVVTAVDIEKDGNTELNGFFIQNGKADEDGTSVVESYDISQADGGGIYLQNASPELKYLWFRNNMSTDRGGAVFMNENSFPNILYAFFNDNEANDGGALYNYSLPLDPEKFHSWEDSTVILQNVLFNDNKAEVSGGAIYNMGKMQTSNVTIADNTSRYGTGIYIESGRLRINNTVISTNALRQDSLYVDPVDGNRLDSLFTRYYSLVCDLDSGSGYGNIPASTDPAFTGTGKYPYQLQPLGPLVDSGHTGDEYYIIGEAEEDLDLAGLPRLQGEYNHIDIGAFEGEHGCPKHKEAYEETRTIFVRMDGDGYGTSWECSYPTLSQALEKARELNTEDYGFIYQIVVAKGTYYPEFVNGLDDSDPRNKAFLLVDEVNILGGFPDNLEGTYYDEDNRPHIDETILSGDIGYGGLEENKDDKDEYDVLNADGTFENTSDNAYHVVLAVDLHGPVTLDGFIIEGGNADSMNEYLFTLGGKDTWIETYNGGGMYINSNSPVYLRNVFFRNNTANQGAGKGGALYAVGSDYIDEEESNYSTIRIDNNEEYYPYVRQNHAALGGGFYLKVGTIGEIRGYSFENNTASEGGALYIDSEFSTYNSMLVDVEFTDNQADGRGGGIYSRAIKRDLETQGIVLDLFEVTFDSNTALYGGALYHNSQDIEHELIIGMSYFMNNKSHISGGALYLNPEDSDPEYRHSVSFSSVTFSNNRALTGNGGALYSKNFRYYLDYIEFDRNTADNGSGGALYNLCASNPDVDARFTNNRAKNAGGAIYNQNVEEMYITHGYMKNNSVADMGLGGAMFNTNSFINISPYDELFYEISENIAGGEGGAITNYNGSKGIYEWIKVYDNRTEGYGGGISNSCSDLVMKNVMVIDNAATADIITERGGGGIFNANSSLNLVNTSIVRNTSSLYGGGGMFNLGDTFDLEASNSKPFRVIMTNVTLADNIYGRYKDEDITENAGSAILNKGETVTSEIYNSIIWGNEPTSEEVNPVLNLDNSWAKIGHTILEKSGGTSNSSTWEPDERNIGKDLGGNLDKDPLFEIIPTGHFLIKKGSPAAGRGKYADYYEIYADIYESGNLSNDKDLAGENRLHEVSSNKILISMGAYEQEPDSRNYWVGTDKITEEGKSFWSEPVNWSLGVLPEPADTVVYRDDAVNLWVDNDESGKGRIVAGITNNGTGKNLIIDTDGALKITTSDIDIADADIIIKAEDPNKSSANGAFIVPAGTEINAKVELYSRATTTADVDEKYHAEIISKSEWQYFGAPVKEAAKDIFEGHYVRRYDEALTKRDPNGDGTDRIYYWHWLQQNEVMTPGRGYEISRKVIYGEKNVEFKGELITEDVVIENLSVSDEASFKGQHVLSNPYTAALSIEKGLEFGKGLEQTVFVFHTGTPEQWKEEDEKGHAEEDGNIRQGQYLAVPKGNANEILKYLASMQGFVVKVDLKSEFTTPEDRKIKLLYEAGTEDNFNVPMRSQAVSEKVYSNISLISDDELKDRMWLFTNENSTRGFDNGYDGRKMVGNADHAQIYAKEQDGSYQVNTVPDVDGTYLNFKAEKGVREYTLLFNHTNLEKKYHALFLTDLKTGITTDITSDGSSYSFYGDNEKSAEKRFLISAVNPDDEDGNNGKITVYQQSGNIFISNRFDSSVEVSIYTATGMMMQNFSINARSNTSVSEGQFIPGVYMLRMKVAGDKTYSEKIIIRK